MTRTDALAHLVTAQIGAIVLAAGRHATTLRRRGDDGALRKAARLARIGDAWAMLSPTELRVMTAEIGAAPLAVAAPEVS